jgi:hypothetical protein
MRQLEKGILLFQQRLHKDSTKNPPLQHHYQSIPFQTLLLFVFVDSCSRREYHTESQSQMVLKEVNHEVIEP